MARDRGRATRGRLGHGRARWVGARAAALRTRLGRVDLVVDTAVGASALTGLAVAGKVSAVLAGTLVVGLGTGFLVLRNPAMSMLLQAFGYASFLWTLWHLGEPAVWLPLVTVAGLLILFHRRLFETVLPGFFGGLVMLSHRRSRFDL